MKISIQSILAAGCDHIWHELLLAGDRDGDVLTIEDHIAQPIISQCRGTLTNLTDPQLIRHQVNITVRGHDSMPPPWAAQPLSLDEWPVPLRLLAASRQQSDTGLGDVIERIIGPIGGEAFKVWFKRATGKDCGCGHRKEWLNQRYPLKSN